MVRCGYFATVLEGPDLAYQHTRTLISTFDGSGIACLSLVGCSGIPLCWGGFNSMLIAASKVLALGDLSLEVWTGLK